MHSDSLSKQDTRQQRSMQQPSGAVLIERCESLDASDSGSDVAEYCCRNARRLAVQMSHLSSVTTPVPKPTQVQCNLGLYGIVHSNGRAGDPPCTSSHQTCIVSDLASQSTKCSCTNMFGMEPMIVPVRCCHPVGHKSKTSWFAGVNAVTNRRQLKWQACDD